MIGQSGLLLLNKLTAAPDQATEDAPLATLARAGVAATGKGGGFAGAMAEIDTPAVGQDILDSSGIEGEEQPSSPIKMLGQSRADAGRQPGPISASPVTFEKGLIEEAVAATMAQDTPKSPATAPPAPVRWSFLSNEAGAAVERPGVAVDAKNAEDGAAADARIPAKFDQPAPEKAPRPDFATPRIPETAPKPGPIENGPRAAGVIGVGDRRQKDTTQSDSLTVSPRRMLERADGEVEAEAAIQRHTVRARSSHSAEDAEPKLGGRIPGDIGQDSAQNATPFAAEPKAATTDDGKAASPESAVSPLPDRAETSGKEPLSTVRSGPKDPPPGLPLSSYPPEKTEIDQSVAQAAPPADAEAAQGRGERRTDFRASERSDLPHPSSDAGLKAAGREAASNEDAIRHLPTQTERLSPEAPPAPFHPEPRSPEATLTQTSPTGPTQSGVQGDAPTASIAMPASPENRPVLTGERPAPRRLQATGSAAAQAKASLSVSAAPDGGGNQTPAAAPKGEIQFAAPASITDPARDEPAIAALAPRPTSSAPVSAAPPAARPVTSLTATPGLTPALATRDWLDDQGGGQISALTPASSGAARVDGPAAPTPVAADPKAVTQQIAQALVRMDGARTEVTLEPVELGRVSLTFVAKDDGVNVLVSAERSETADLLRRNSEQLQRDLTNAGYEGVEMDFEASGGDHDERQSPDNIDMTEASSGDRTQYRTIRLGAGLDIRL